MEPERSFRTARKHSAPRESFCSYLRWCTYTHLSTARSRMRLSPRTYKRFYVTALSDTRRCHRLCHTTFAFAPVFALQECTASLLFPRRDQHFLRATLRLLLLARRKEEIASTRRGTLFSVSTGFFEYSCEYLSLSLSLCSE